jgi:hypothetical protein
MSTGSQLAVLNKKVWRGFRLRNLFLASAVFFAAFPSFAQLAPPNADYVCTFGCRLTDANPRLEIKGAVARCWNEFGGIYVGEFRPPDSLACFHKIGRILGGGARVEWSDGVVWQRR